MEDCCMNIKTISGMKYILCLVGLFVLALPAKAASFDCAKATTTVEKVICGDVKLSKLDEELDAAYKMALQDHTRAEATKISQRQWLRERNLCLTAVCLQAIYKDRKSNLQILISPEVQSDTTVIADQSKIIYGNSHEEISASNQAKGDFVIVQDAFREHVCQRFKDNLNQFRNLDFDQCNPRLSGKLHKFSRPYTWKEIPFDMALAEKAIRSTVDLTMSLDEEGLAYQRKEQEDRWVRWKKDSEPIRASGKAHMWITKIDIDGDGLDDTILRMLPGGRYRIDPERLTTWSCDYNLGELYVVDSASTSMATSFNVNAWSGSDIIHYAEDNHFYLLDWLPGSSIGFGQSRVNVASVRGTRGVVVYTLYRREKDTDTTPASICLIDWVPKEHGVSASHLDHK